MDKVPRFGSTTPSMKASGRMIRLTDRVRCITLMEMFTQATGRMTKRMGSASIPTTMEPRMRVSGKRISSMAMEQKHGLMVPNMLENTNTGKSMGRVF